MSPYRTALIGLSASAKTSWASGAHLPGLLTPRGRSLLPIHALLNSSTSAAQSAISTYNLDPSTKAYGNPEDLANDPDIDLVICNTRVDKHFETILPSIKKGKDVYVEWPIAASPKEIGIIVDEARKSGSRVAVGLQRRWTAPVLKMKELVDGGKYGRVLSVEVRAYGGTNGKDVVPAGLRYFLDRNVGGNFVTISLAHILDYVLSVTGELDPASSKAGLHLQRPSNRVRDPDQQDKIVETVQSNVPDLFALHGTTSAPSPSFLSFFFRRGQPFPGEPACTWTIMLEHAEIQLVSPASIVLQAAANGKPITIHVNDFESGKVEEVQWEWSEELEKIPDLARSVTRSLFEFAEGKKEGDGWVGLEDAARRAEMLEGWLAAWENSQS